MSKSICVIGSARMDLIVHAPRAARAGERVLGEDFVLLPSGRGASQAVAASRMGAQVSFVGSIGDDEWGSELRSALTAEGVDIHHLRTCDGTSTGLGMITLLPKGKQAMTVVPGANAKLGPADIDAASKEIRAADMLLLQGELSEEANVRAIEIAKDTTLVVLHAAPAQGASTQLLQGTDLLVATRSEACALLGDAEQDIAPAGLARRLACLGPERVVLALGAEGAIHFNGQEVKSFDGIAGEVADPFFGGQDAFLGALVVQRAEGARLKDAVRFACAAAALSRPTGGLADLPTREKVEELLRRESA